MAELKTKENDQDVRTFLDAVADDKRREDALAMLKIMQQVTRLEPKMWGDAIVGFGQYHYKYASGREGDWFVSGFSPRKQALTLYLMSGFDPLEEDLALLGKFKLGKCCLYIKKLEDIDLKVLKRLIRTSAKIVNKHQGCGPSS